NESDDRLLTNALPKCLHSPSGKTPAALRLMAASPNCLSARVALVIGSVTEKPLLTAPIANWEASRSSAALQAEPVQVRRPRLTTLPPEAKSKVMRRSPAVRTGVTPLLLMVWDWLNSKSMLAVPSVFARSHPRYMKIWLLTVSALT